MGFLNFLKSRYSVRDFEEKQVSKKHLDKILEAGRIAPTSKNFQAFKIVVVKSENGIAKLNNLTKCLYGAKMCLIVCYDKNEVWINKRRGQYHTGEIDCAVVTTHMMLEAYDLGIGSVMVGMFNDEEVREAFSLDENLVPTLLLPIGYPKLESKPSDLHDEKKSIEDIVIYK